MASEGVNDMAMFIILTPDEAGIVRDSISSTIPRYVPIGRGEWTEGEPPPCYILPISILSAPAHAQWHDFLSELPTMDHNDSSFPIAWEPPEV